MKKKLQRKKNQTCMTNLKWDSPSWKVATQVNLGRIVL